MLEASDVADAVLLAYNQAQAPRHRNTNANDGEALA
jgi:hypothetical protein